MKLQLLTCGLVLGQKTRPTFSPEQSVKRYTSIRNQYQEMTEHFFVSATAEAEPLAKSTENRQAVVDRYNTRFGDLLMELETLWKECGVNGDQLNSRSIRYDKSNWRRAFNQMRTGVNRIIESELQCENCCTEAKKTRKN
jgi:predicted nuclease with TOPRIM domain